jgi:ribosome biogenesis GTPase
MENGRILKGIGGFYYVKTRQDVVECKARGIFRNRNEKPYVGDQVNITRNDDRSGNIEEILPRTSLLIRPPIANATQVVVVFTWKEPKLNTELLQRVVLSGEKEGLRVVICFNKAELMDEEDRAQAIAMFVGTGYPVLFTSVWQEENLDQLRTQLQGQISLLAGPSGVGKSSLIRKLSHGDHQVEIGALSDKIKRGKHTTRHVELFALSDDGYIADTPGFGNLAVETMEPQDLEFLFPEFDDYREGCRFKGCLHINEPNCMVKEAVGKGISPLRYAFYKTIHLEVKNGPRA